MWNRGIVIANDCVAQSSFQDLGSPDKSIDIRGSPTFGVYQSSPKSKNLFAGGTGVGLDSASALDARAALHVGSGGLRVDGPVRFSERAEGTVILDAQGEATVSAAVEATNDASLQRLAYGLTAVGAPMPELHVMEEAVSAGAGGGIAFRVGGGSPGKRVSWWVALPPETDAA